MNKKRDLLYRRLNRSSIGRNRIRKHGLTALINLYRVYTFTFVDRTNDSTKQLIKSWVEHINGTTQPVVPNPPMVAVINNGEIQMGVMEQPYVGTPCSVTILPVKGY